MNERILVVDDDEGVREAIKLTLEYEGYTCLFARSGQEGLDRAAADSPDLVLLDVKMPGMDGLEVLRRMRRARRHRAGHRDFRARDDQHGGRGDDTGRVHVPRKRVRG